MAKVEIEKLLKVYPDRSGVGIRAVDGISLAVQDREFMVLVGPSGCGKTTALRLIAGLEEATGGTVSIDGRVVNRVPPKDRDIAMVFQNYALYPHMTAFENMAFGLRLRGLPRAEIEGRVGEAASLLGLGDCLGRKPKALSGGQRQRVALGRAIVRRPKVFLFDEPLSNLDAKMRVSTRAELSRIHARLGATMIYVTHDQAEAMTLGDRICVMEGGRIQQVDDPLALYHRPANLFVAGFIGSPAMNLFRGAVRRAGDRLEFVEDNPGGPPARFRLDERLSLRVAGRADRPVVLGLRPEDLGEPLAGPAPAGAALVEAVLEVIEPMGAETYLHLFTGATGFVARIHPRPGLSVNQRIRLAPNLERAHFFDPETGAALA